MATNKRWLVGCVGALAGVATIAWGGLHIPSQRFPSHPQRTRDLGVVDVPGDLPTPVRRHFAATFGQQVPKIESAVIWGEARWKVAGLWMPTRFEAIYLAGRDFYRAMEVTWFGRPILRGEEGYRNGQGAQRLKGLVNRYGAGSKVTQAQNMAMWAEAMWLPTVYLVGERARWEAVDEETAKLVFPLGEGEDHLRVAFDPQTGLMWRMAGMRWRDDEARKIPWRVEFDSWRIFHPAIVPARLIVSWGDAVGTYAILQAEGVEYNVNVDNAILPI